MIRIPEGLKGPLSRSATFQRTWGAWRRKHLHQAYERRREHYARRAMEAGLAYSEADTGAKVRARLGARGYTPSVRDFGQIHTVVYVPRRHWEGDLYNDLYNDLYELGPVTEFDYTAYGIRLEHDESSVVRARLAIRDRFLTQLRAAHEKCPIDWIFMYASGLDFEPETLDCITGEFGVPIVTVDLDDKQGWEGTVVNGYRTGQQRIAAHVDLSWTTARVATEWYLVEGGRPIFMPEGFDLQTIGSADGEVSAAAEYDVSFVGRSYGYRPDIIRQLRRHNIDMAVFGSGWIGSAPADSLAGVARRSLVNLGLGGVGYSDTLLNLKGRDFDIPAAGGGVYVTAYNADLASSFRIGEEVVCYGSFLELVELLRYYLVHTEEARAIARRARDRCLGEHRWLNRYVRLCELIGILPDEDEDG